jgi:hypothetical protein
MHPAPHRRLGRHAHDRLDIGVKTFTGIAALVAVLLIPSTAAQAQLPVGEADGVRMVAQRGGVLVIFTARAEKLRRRYAGKVLEISCTDFVEDGASVFGEGLRVPRHRHRVFAGDHPRGTDYCRLWLPKRTVKRRHRRVAFGRELLVSVPLTQQGAVYLDEEEKTQGIFGVLVIASLSANGEELGRYRTYDELIAKYPKAARAVVELDAPVDSPPAGKIGFYSDGAAHLLVAALSATGRRLFIEYEGDVLSTNVAGYMFSRPD